MKNIIKQPDRHSCMVCVASMITNKDLKYVTDFIGHDGSEFSFTSGHPLRYRGFGMIEVMQYLLSERFMLGHFYRSSDKDGLLKIKSKDKELNIVFNLKNPAMLVVVSQVFGSKVRHVVYWDGEDVLDPNPDVQGLRKLEDYEITEWWPVVRFEESVEDL